LHPHAVDPDGHLAGRHEIGRLCHEPSYRPGAANSEAVPIAACDSAVLESLQRFEACGFLNLKLYNPPRSPRPNVIENLDAHTVPRSATNRYWFDIIRWKRQDFRHPNLHHNRHGAVR
jgi:hypothetical protein